ncbi:MAG: stage V sporulation protein AC [Clostridiales bacterium]|nr:stage V sporulation protein AC [Clostridiales bacterium]
MNRKGEKTVNRQRIHTDPQHYNYLTEKLSPPSKLGSGLLRAFWVGGLICVLGQAIADAGVAFLKLSTTDGYSLAAIVLVFLTALLTGIGVFDKIGKYAGAGSFVPISGFANAMVSPALEFRREGLVLGLGAKLFTIAGPVLVYGIGASVLVGLIYAILFH